MVKRSRRRMTGLGSVLSLSPLVLTFSTGCGAGAPGEGQGAPDQTSFEASPAVEGDAEPARPGASSADTLYVDEPAGESSQEAQAAAFAQEAGPSDSIQIRLDALAATQELILARLDSVRTSASAGQTDTASTDPAALDLTEAREEVRGLGVGIFWSLVVIIFFHFLIRILVWTLEALAERSVRRRLTFKSLIPMSRMLLWAIAAYLILRTVFRVDTQGILAASAALGVALGFAAQDLLKNVFGGLIVVFDQPFQVGDKIRVGGTYGEVASIGLRSTRIVTADDNLVSVPNAQVVQESVANANAGQLNCQVVTDLYLPGRVDERRARAIAFEAAVTSKYVFLNKPVVVLVGDEFRTTFLTRVRVKAYVLDTRFEFLFQSDITERARDGFRSAGLVADHDWYPAVEPSVPAGPDGPPAGGQAWT